MRRRQSSVRVTCPKCGDEMSEKSLKRHLDDHNNVRYPCTYCARDFSQKPNRDSHQRSHNDEWLQCDVCGVTCKQNSEMTRHKQEAHGHPRRGEKASDSRRVTHSVVIVPAEGTVARGKARSTKVSRRSKPYAMPRKHSPRSSEPSSSSSSQDFFSTLNTSEPPSSPFTASFTPASSSFLDPFFDIAFPPSLSLTMPQTSFDEPSGSADGFDQGTNWHWPADLSSFDSPFSPSQLPRPENPYHELQEHFELAAPILDASFTNPVPPFNVEQHVFPDLPPYTSPFSREAPLPAGVEYFHGGADYQQGYVTGEYLSLNYSDTPPAVELWEFLSPEKQQELISALPQCLDSLSLAPAPALPNDEQTLTYGSNWRPFADWMGSPCDETLLNSLLEMESQDHFFSNLD